MSQWYFARAGLKVGPVTFTELQQLAVSGELLPTGMVLQEGHQQWIMASEVSCLFRDVAPPSYPMASLAPATSDQWFYAEGEQTCGPVSTADLKRLADQNRLQADQLVWKEGFEEWMPALNVVGLFPEVEASLRANVPPFPAAPLSLPAPPPVPPSPYQPVASPAKAPGLTLTKKQHLRVRNILWASCFILFVLGILGMIIDVCRGSASSRSFGFSPCPCCLFLVVFTLAVGCSGAASQSAKQACPACGEWSHRKVLGERLVARKYAYKLVARPGFHLTLFRGSVHGGAAGGSVQQQQALVLRETYEQLWGCRYCPHRWVEKVQRDRQEFEFD